MLGLHPLIGDLLRLAAHGGTAYLAIYIGTTQKGFMSALGWSVGILHGLGAFMDLLSVTKTLSEIANGQERTELPQQPVFVQQPSSPFPLEVAA